MTNVTTSAALLKKFPMGSKDTVLPDPLLEIPSVKFLAIEENTRKLHNDNLCLFRALALHLHGNKKLEEKKLSNCSIFSPKKLVGLILQTFKVFVWNTLQQ